MLLRKIEIALCNRYIETSTRILCFIKYLFVDISFDTRTCLHDDELTLRLEIV